MYLLFEPNSISKLAIDYFTLEKNVVNKINNGQNCPFPQMTPKTVKLHFTVLMFINLCVGLKT